MRERHHLEDPGVDGRIILKRIFKKEKEYVEWIDLAKDKDRWLTLVKAVINIRVSYSLRNFLTTKNCQLPSNNCAAA